MIQNFSKFPTSITGGVVVDVAHNIVVRNEFIKFFILNPESQFDHFRVMYKGSQYVVEGGSDGERYDGARHQDLL
jgi:hypothetical protein